MKTAFALRFVCCAVFAFAVASCTSSSSPLSSGVMTLGPDTYRITGSRGVIFGGNTAAEKDALDEGNKFCAQQNKQFMAIGTYNRGENTAAVGLITNTGGGYQLDFRCLNSNDPGLARPTPTPAPNIVIQDQRQR